MGIELDWAAEWQSHWRGKSNSIGSDYWDKRSVGFKAHTGFSEYTSTFLEYLTIAPDDTVLDIGCGGGTLAIPLAKAGHRVIAADFSPKMLALTAEFASREGVSDLVITKQLDWEEDWQAAGIEPKSVDIAIASRSTMVRDLADCLSKLNTVARKKVALTLATDNGPRNFREILASIGRPIVKRPDFLYGLNLLLQWGLDPELRYIDSYKTESFDSYESAQDYFDEFIDDLSDNERLLVARYLDEHLVEDRSGAKKYRIDKKRLIRWAYLSWQPDRKTPRW